MCGNVITDALVAVILSAIMLFAVGWYEARVTVGSLWVSGVRMLAIGLAAGFAGFLVGTLIHLFTGGVVL